jgi:hypothetical protein
MAAQKSTTQDVVSVVALLIGGYLLLKLLPGILRTLTPGASSKGVSPSGATDGLLPPAGPGTPSKPTSPFGASNSNAPKSGGFDQTIPIQNSPLAYLLNGGPAPQTPDTSLDNTFIPLASYPDLPTSAYNLLSPGDSGISSATPFGISNDLTYLSQTTSSLPSWDYVTQSAPDSGNSSFANDLSSQFPSLFGNPNAPNLDSTPSTGSSWDNNGESSWYGGDPTQAYNDGSNDPGYQGGDSSGDTQVADNGGDTSAGDTSAGDPGISSGVDG